MARRAIATMLVAGLVLCTAGAAQAGLVSDLQAYYDFEVYTGGPNPAGMPQGNDANEGSFADQSGGGNAAYAADLGGTNFVPHAPAGGKFGGAFYSQTPASGTGSNGGSMAVVQNQSVGTFNDQSFTVSFWEKALFRSTTNSWVPGGGRSLLFAKGPDVGAIAAGTKEGYGLLFTQGRFDFVSNGPPNDNFFQAQEARLNPHGNWDNGQWAQYTMTATYDAPNSEYDVQVYVNGAPLGGPFAGLSIPEDQMETDGFFTIGSHWRNNGWPHQRFPSWHLRPDNVVDGEAWIDDFGVIGQAMTPAEVAAMVNLGNSALAYELGDVLPVLDAYATGGTALIDGLEWTPAAGLSGTPGEVSESGGVWTLVMDPTQGGGMIGAAPGPGGDDIPEPATMALLSLAACGLGGYVRRRRKA